MQSKYRLQQHHYLNFNKENQTPLNVVAISEAQRYIQEGHFEEGSMLPKIEAAVDFITGGGKEVIITDGEHLLDALQGKAGTRIVVPLKSQIFGSLTAAFEKAREGVAEPKDYWLRPVVACDAQGRPLGNI